MDLLGDPVEICTLSLIWGISSLISTGFDFQSSGFFLKIITLVLCFGFVYLGIFGELDLNLELITTGGTLVVGGVARQDQEGHLDPEHRLCQTTTRHSMSSFTHQKTIKRPLNLCGIIGGREPPLSKLVLITSQQPSDRFPSIGVS